MSKMWWLHSWFTFRAFCALHWRFAPESPRLSELPCRRITAPARICLRFTCSTCWVAQQFSRCITGETSQLREDLDDSSGILYLFGDNIIKGTRGGTCHAARDLQQWQPVAHRGIVERNWPICGQLFASPTNEADGDGFSSATVG